MFAGSPGMTQQRQKCLGRADVKRQSALGCAEGPMGTNQARRKPEAMAVPGTACAKTKKQAVKSGAFEKSQDFGYDAGKGWEGARRLRWVGPRTVSCPLLEQTSDGSQSPRASCYLFQRVK